MAGQVQLWGAAAASSGVGAIVSFEHRRPCGATESFAEWLARSPDGGTRWTVTREPFFLMTAGF